jgi:MFS family permease
MTAASASAAQPSTFSVFRNRNFSLLWTGQLVSTAGSALTSLTAGILVYRVTGSAMSVGLMMMATTLPTLLLGLIAGVFVDRFDRRRVMMTADLLRAMLVFLIPLLIPSTLAWLYIMVALSSAVNQFFDPAQSSLLPELASDEELAAANSMMTISTIGAEAIGFSLAGLISSMSIEWAFYINSATFLFSALCIFLIRVTSNKVEGQTSATAVVHNLKGGFKLIGRTPILRSLFIVYLPVFITFGLNDALMLPFARRALDASEAQYGLLQGIITTGFVIGGFAMARYGNRWREGQWIAVSFIGMAIGSIIYSQLHSVPLAIVIGTFVSTLNAPSVVGRQLIIQRQTPREMRGRIFSAFYVMRDTMFMLGMAMSGLADIIDVRTLFLLQALAFLAVGTLAFVLPGLGQPAAEWKRAIKLLRGVKAALGLGVGRAATIADFDRLATHISAFLTLSAKERQELAAETLLADALIGSVIIRKGETSDAAYFVIDGRAIAGWDEEGRYRPLETLNPGDFFGEIAALTGAVRTANVVADEPTTVLQVPADTLRRMSRHPELNRLFLTKMTERMVRMNMIEAPRTGGMDQAVLRDLRKAEPKPMEDAPGPSLAAAA